MSWNQGKILSGSEDKYTIERELGQGGFSITYLAKDTHGSKWAIKTLNDDIRRRPDFKKLQDKFVKEAEYLQSCDHPHIVKYQKLILEEDENLWCIVMEYIEGDNLATIVQKYGVLTEQEAIKYIQQIASALQEVHRQNILHRDVNPANIIKRKNKQEVILIDFGISRNFKRNQHQNQTVFATEGYTPIEQYIHRWHRGEYTDVYALSATLYVLLTGYSQPQPGIYYHFLPSALERDNAIANNEVDPLQPPNKINNENISEYVNKAILRGMAFSPNKRPETVQSWLNMLDPNFVTYQPDILTIFGIQKLYQTAIQKLQNTKIMNLSNIKTLQVPIQAINKLAIKNNVPPFVVWSGIFFVVIILYYFHPDLKGPIRSPAVVDYKPLEQFLSSQKFEDADKETLRIMQLLANRQGQSFTADSIDDIRCDDLQTINQLWIDNSNKQFGFTIQKQIWNKLKGEVGVYDSTIADKFANKVGWRVDNKWYKNINYELFVAPKGHLPFRVTSSTEGFGVPYLAKRLQSCNILK
ncbi:MAG: serine/threonine-protein kinase [Dolichospermum lemmermannii FEM_B0920]